MWPIILTLLTIGGLLLVVEVFVPGLIVGTLGVLALIAATILTYIHYGANAGTLLLVAEVFGGIIFTIWWLRYVPRSSFARRWSLSTAVPPGRKTELHALLGEEGEAVSPLRPSGIADIVGRRLDVVTEGDLIPEGERIRVVHIEGNRIVVRRVGDRPEISA